MSDIEFQAICDFATQTLRALSPIDTGNLRYNAIKFKWVNSSTFEIYVDPKIAPYMVYTEEPWINRPGTNPNEGWFKNAVELISKLIASTVNGRVIRV